MQGKHAFVSQIHRTSLALCIALVARRYDNWCDSLIVIWQLFRHPHESITQLGRTLAFPPGQVRTLEVDQAFQ